MTVDSSGPFFFDTGTMESGFVARGGAAGDSPRATPIVHALPRGPDPAIGTAELYVPNVTAPSRLAGNGTAGFFIAAGKSVREVDATNTLIRVIGSQPDSATAMPSALDYSGPASQAVFLSARSVATDEAANLFIADLVDAQKATLRVRFLNRGSQPILFYPGTPSEIKIGPGEIATVAGVPGNSNSGDGGPARLATIQGVPPSIAVIQGRLYLGLYWGTGSAKLGRVRMINLTGASVSVHGTNVGPGNIETIAQGSQAGIDDKGNLRAGPQFSYVPGIAADRQNNLYLADVLRHRIIKIDGSGSRTIFAGTGRPGFNGNDRPAGKALLNLPYDVKVGPQGMVYISDRANGQIRVVDGAGTIRAAPGSGAGTAWRCLSRRESEKAGSVESPQPGNPRSVVADNSGNIYFVLPGRAKVKKLDTNEVVSTFAGIETTNSHPCGTNPCPFSGKNGQAKSAKLIEPSALAFRPEGLYILDVGHRRVFFVNWGRKTVAVHGISVPSGGVKAVAGSGRRGSAGDGGPATKADLNPDLFEKGSLAADNQGNLFVGEGGNHRIRRVDPQGNISTFAGQGATAALRTCCADPVAMTVDSANNLYVADLGRLGPEFQESPRVWVINRGRVPLRAFGQDVAPLRAAPVAGNGSVGLEGDAPSAVDAPLLKLTGLAMSTQGQLYIAETAGVTRKTFDLGPIGSIRSIDRTGRLSSVAGSGVFGFNGDGMKAKLTSVYPGQLSLDSCGNLLIADEGHDRVRRLYLTDRCQRPAPHKAK